MDGEQFDIAVALTGLELVFVHDEYVVIARGRHMKEVLPDKPIRCREAALEESRSIDVVVLGAGEDEPVREQSLGQFAVLP